MQATATSGWSSRTGPGRRRLSHYWVYKLCLGSISWFEIAFFSCLPSSAPLLWQRMRQLQILGSRSSVYANKKDFYFVILFFVFLFFVLISSASISSLLTQVRRRNVLCLLRRLLRVFWVVRLTPILAWQRVHPPNLRCLPIRNCIWPWWLWWSEHVPPLPCPLPVRKHPSVE